MNAEGTFERNPPVYEESVSHDLLSYIKGYPIVNQRLLWGADNKSTNLPYRDLRLNIARLIDPIAFECGQEDAVEDVERVLDTLESPQGLSEGVVIRTGIEQVGKSKWFGLTYTDSILTTELETGYFSESDLMSEPITYPSKKSEAHWTSLRTTLDEWQSQIDSVFQRVKAPTTIELYMGPSEDGQLTYGLGVETPPVRKI